MNAARYPLNVPAINQRQKARGMTLIEVMVALVILALVATSILSMIGQNARFIASAEDRLMASILADNILVERLATLAPLEEGEENYDLEFGGREWACREIVTEVPGVGLLRIDLSVSAKSTEQVLATVTTLKAPE